MIEKIWNREKIIQMVRELHKKGEYLDMTSVLLNHPRLYSAANRHFPGEGWKRVLELAGISYSDIRKKRGWSKLNVIEQICLRHEQGKSLRPKDNPKLKDAARRYFGSYEKAMQAAGLSYKVLSIPHLSLPAEKWGKEKVIRTILDIYERGEALNESYVRRKYPRLLGIAYYYFKKGWRKILEELGIDYTCIKKELRARGGVKLWSREKVIDQIRLLHLEGKSLHPKANASLFNAATRYLGSYESAIVAAGLSYQELGIRSSSQKWDREKVIKELQRRFAEGKSLRYNEVRRQAKSLYGAANHYFAGYANAVEAAGIDYSKEVRKVKYIGDWIKGLTAEDMQRIESQLSSLGERKEDTNEKDEKQADKRTGGRSYRDG